MPKGGNVDGLYKQLQGHFEIKLPNKDI